MPCELKHRFDDPPEFYRAITIKQPFATLISTGRKTIETRNWKTDYRGPILIHAAASVHEGLVVNGPKHGNSLSMARTMVSANPRLYPLSTALCLVDIVNVCPMTKQDEQAAMCEFYEGMFAWELKNWRLVRPYEMKGRQGLFRVEGKFIKPYCP